MSLILDLVIASRTLAEFAVIDAYGHVSARSDTDPQRYFLAQNVAPELIVEEDILEFDLESRPVIPTDKGLYQERFIHGEIYKTRPDVNAIVHNHSPSVVPFACTGTELKPIYHMAAFVGLGVPSWDIRDAQKGTDMLVKTPYLGEHLAQRLGKHPAVLMRGHGSTVVAENIQRAVGRTIYLDDEKVNANVSWQNYVRSWSLWKTRALAKLAAEKQTKK